MLNIHGIEETPLSELAHKIKSATKEECIEALRFIAEANPEQVISRNYFRVNGPLAESAWSKHFGTFEEFKRGAGIKLSRNARKMELDVAKHASMDSLRGMTNEKRSWQGQYARDHAGRWQTVLVGSDIHDIECCEFWRACFVDTASRVQPEKIVLNGDLFDLPEFGKYSVDPREWDVVGRIKWVHGFLAELREVAPDSELILIEGNHEYRLLRHLAEATPAMRAVLSDLHHWTVPDLLGLTEFQINYIAPADLATFTKTEQKDQLKRNWITLYDHLIAHHFPEGKNFGLPGWNGHHHTHKVETFFNPVQGSYEWHQLGSGHKREASYCNGEKWTNGFLLVHVDTHKRHSQFEYIDTTYDHCVIGGKWYHR